MKVTDLALPGLKLIEPTYFEDHRGYFCETYSQRTFAEYGIDCLFVQDNHSMTKYAGTIRGIHCQKEPAAQGKLVRCTRGRIRDYAVDFRKDSDTYKQWICVELSEENRRQLWIPAGFGHAFLSLVDNCEVQYKATAFYAPDLDCSVLWSDPEIGIDWGIREPILSDKDASAKPLKDCGLNFRVNS